MKRHLPFAIVCLSLSLFWAPQNGASAQDAVAAAAREEIVESLRTLAARVERLEEANHSYQTRIEKMEREIYRVRDDVERQKNRNENAATLEKISRLQDAIKQVDEARLEDKKKAAADLERLRSVLDKAARNIATPPSASERPERSSPSPSNPSEGPTSRHDKDSSRSDNSRSGPENGYKYAIKKGDTLMGIINALKAEGYKVTRKQMEEANPKVNWDKLQVGKEIFIPPPSP